MTLLTIVPPIGLVQVSVYVFDDVRTPVATVPESSLEPDQSPDAVQEPETMLDSLQFMLVPVP